MHVRPGLTAGCMVTATVAVVSLGCAQDLAGTVVVNPAERYQTIVGWEATAYAGQGIEGNALERVRDDLFDQAVNELGLTRLRLEVRAGGESDRDYFALQAAGGVSYEEWRQKRYATVNDNDDPDVIAWNGFHFSELDSTVKTVLLPLREHAAAAGVRLWVNLCYVAFTGQMARGDDYVHEDPREYAEYIEVVWRHLSDTYGFVPDSLEIILEPDNTDEWDGRRIGRAIVEVARRLEAAGFEVPGFVAPSTTDMGNAIDFFDDMIDVDGVADLLSELSYHRYRGVSSRNLEQIRERSERYGIPTAMLEKIGASAEALVADLTTGGNSAWSQFTLAGQDNGGGNYYFIDTSDPLNPRVVLDDRARLLRQYFRYVRPGATRVGAVASDDRLEPVAFENADGGVVVVVRASRTGTVTIQGLPPGPYATTFATLATTEPAGPDTVVAAGSDLVVTMPDAGVLTVFAQPE